MPVHLSLGMIETRGLVGAIEAADQAAKTAEIFLIRIETVGGALVTVRFVGETASVREAVQAGAAAATRVGHLVAAHVIPRLDPETAAMLDHGPEGDSPVGEATRASKSPDPQSQSQGDYETMTTSKLRALARSLPDFPVKGRELNRLPKAQIIDELLRLTAQGGHV